MIPCVVVIAHDEYSVIPTKYMLSKTLTGSACHVSRAGGGGGPPPRLPAPAPRPAPPARAAPRFRASVQVRSKIAVCSVPAAALAAAMCFSTSADDCAAAAATPSAPATTNVANNLVTMSSCVWLLSLRFVDVRALAKEHFSALHDRLRQCRVRVDHDLHVFRGGPHLDREHAFSDQLSRTGARHSNAEHAPCFRLEHEFGQPLGPIDGNRAAQRAPWEFGNL